MSPRVVRIKEDLPIGTVIVPDLISFIKGRSFDLSDNQFKVSQTKSPDSLLAIGNAVMPGANWFAIDESKQSLVVKIPPDRDLLCPIKNQYLPNNAVQIARGGIEFPDLFDLNRDGLNFNLPPKEDECQIKLSIIHGSSVNPTFDIITIILEDVNDHVPTFDILNNHDSNTKEHVISIPETLATITNPKTDYTNKYLTNDNIIRIPLPTAKDMDFGINNIKGYRLDGEDSFLFRLEVGPTLETTNKQNKNKFSNYQQETLYSTYQKPNKLWLIPIGSGGFSHDGAGMNELNREQRSEYHLTLIAYDGGSPTRVGKLPIKLLIKDLNDHVPEFSHEFYSGQMSENDEVGHVLFEFSARDGDSTKDNNLIKFSIPGKNDFNQNRGLFDNTLPENYLELLDNQLAAIDLFDIEYLIDKNNEIGHTLDNIYQNNTIYGKLVIKRQSRDNLQRAVSRAITIGKQQKHTLFNKESSLQYGNQLSLSNYMTELAIQFYFYIEAYDNGYPKPLIARVPVYIQITDVNNHAPQIFISYLKPTHPIQQLHLSNTDRRHMWGKLRENLDRAMIAQITVTDKDASFTNSDIMCKTNDSRFALEDILHQMDPSSSSSSSSSNSLSNWDRNMMYMQKTNNMPNQFGEYGQTNILNPQTDLIHSKMYKLMSIIPLDREYANLKPAWIKFTIICADNQQSKLPGGSLTSEVEVFIIVEDGNDNAPVFDHAQYKFHLPENRPEINFHQFGNGLDDSQRYPIGLVRATDKDEGAHSSIEYKIINNPNGAIQIDQMSGMIYTNQPFDRETQHEFAFHVLAIDCKMHTNQSKQLCTNELRLTGTADIRVIVDDLNDSPPIFQTTNYHFEVEECVDLVKVGQVLATDADQNEAGHIFYRLAVTMTPPYTDMSHMYLNKPNLEPRISNAPTIYDEALEITTHFQIDPRNGLIHLKSRLDREKRAHYEFVVLAFDNPHSVSAKIGNFPRNSNNKAIQHTATATVLITVLDHNDNAPKIISPSNHAEFILSTDQLIAGNKIFEIKATDPDLGDNGTIEYRLLHIENDLGVWINHQDHQEHSTIVENSNSMKQNGTDQSVKFNSIHNDNIDNNNNNSLLIPTDMQENNYPFALDKTGGICYLRENLPPLNVKGPRAFVLRILVYDLGKPIQMNTTLIVRVTRQAYQSNNELVNHVLYSNRLNPKEYRQHLKSNYNNYNKRNDGINIKSSLRTYSNKARISDRTMVVILSSVFILLLLTAIVLLLLVKYRHVILRTVPMDRALPHDGAASKANEGFTAGKSV